MHFLLLHLMLRHGVDYLADAILDGAIAAAGWVVRSPAALVRRIQMHVAQGAVARRSTPTTVALDSVSLAGHA